MERYRFVIDGEEEEKRLDVFLAENLDQYSRSYLQKIIKNKGAMINQDIAKSRSLLSEGDIVEIVIPEAKPLEIKEEDLSLDIVYEDKDVIVVNKPRGMVVHPGAGNRSGTLVNGLLYHCKGRLSSINGMIRPGIVHRIDKDTTGLLMVAKNDKAHQFLQEQLKNRTVTRHYELLAHGVIQGGTIEIDAPIGRSPKNPLKMAVVDGGRNAITHFEPLKTYKAVTYGRAKLETGRTHQIRVHFQYIGHPLVGDPLYGPKKAIYHSKGQMLHAKTLGFVHPETNQYMEFEAPLPEDFVKIMEQLDGGIT